MPRKPLTPMKVIRFAAPPAETKSDWKRDLETALKAKPGAWALVAENTYSTRGSREFKGADGYEFRRHYRYDSRSRCDLYMRYIGDSKVTHRGTSV